MPTTLVLRVAGALQSWGTRSHFARRDTEREPTLSGIIGMITNGMGYRREDSLKRFADLTMASRTDRAGTLVDDFYTAGVGAWHGGTTDEDRLYWTAWTSTDGTPNFPKDADSAKGNIGMKHYLADAIFLVLLTSDDPKLIDDCAHALRTPRRAYYLGRRGCIPEQPLVCAITAERPEVLLRSWPWLDHEEQHNAAHQDLAAGRSRQLPVLETAVMGDPLAEVRPDVPLRFDSLHREYRTRLVRRSLVPLTTAMLQAPADAVAQEGEPA
ncbi:type I-E CRISPR-associated protein Cas5/CasD [Frankia sp. Ag45/Mut15]|uniref:Type I-E CRISPR-associated protein Cas5/CasD n=1 Tax=Frankia umida TaxID=573489 RepID=A0ABT0K416_9ACTN|nr:type I-E CRISPR-associated protein Cas5/CasD [Frankia umida]MCK9878259.1 type I-E CRISPR-associated protein Cas5/CasD [Frankia umida]